MAPTSGFYAIYDEENQGVKLVDDEGYQQIKESVTSGRPNIDAIDYEECREKMRFRPIVIRRRPLSPNKPTDLVAVYEPSNQSIIAITRADYEKNKSKYDVGPAPALKPRPAKSGPEAAAPAALTPAFTDIAPVEAPKVAAAPAVKQAPAPAPAEAASFASLIFQPPKIGPVAVSPDDLVAVYDAATQSVIAVKRSQYESGNTACAAKAPAAPAAPAASASTQSAAKKSSDLIFQPPKVGKIQLCPDDLLAVYEPKSQGVILVTRKQYDQGDVSTPAKVVSAPSAQPSSAPQQTTNLIFQAPKIGKVDLCPDDLLAVYEPKTQGVILVTRKQFDKGDISTPATAVSSSKPAAPSAPAAPAASAAPQQTSDLIFQAPKIGKIELCPEDLLAVYHPATQGVVLVTRKQYDAGEMPSGSSAQSFTDLIFQPPKVGPVQLCDDDLIAVYEPDTQSVKTVTRKEFDQMK